MKLLEVENLTVQYPGSTNPACKVSFQVESGELLGIAGASGAGKSTAMLSLMGILPEQVQITSEKLKQHGTKAMIFQDASASLNPLVRVGKQLTETILAHQRCTGKEARERAETLLDEVGIQDPGQRMKQYPFELSGGMKQRVAIAIALACNPDLIIADEPTTALDVTVQRQILDLLKKIAEETHTAIVLVSHDLGVIASMCSRVLVMKEGRIVEEGSMEQIFYEPVHPYTKKLSDMARKLYQVPEKKRTGEVILRTQGLGRSFVKNSLFGKSRSLEAVEPLSFEIHKGETFGLVGESGSGKTTLARMLTGIIPPSCGSFSCEGKIQMIFQEASASFDPEFSLERILEEPLVIQKKGSKKEREKRVAEMLGLVQMEKIDVRKTTAALSGGQRQRIAVARALLLNPELLICDESFSSQDILTQSQLLELLEEIQRKTQLSYLFISHDLQVVRRISQRMGVMYLGSMVEQGLTAEIYEEPWHPYTKELLRAMLPLDPKKAARQKRLILKETRNRSQDTENGCPYAPRCRYAMECCHKEKPGNYRFGEREVRCFLYSEAHTKKRAKDYHMTSQI